MASTLTTPYFIPDVDGTPVSDWPAPLLSSRLRGWTGFAVELRCSHAVDVTIPYHDHAIAVVLAGGPNLYQSRSGRSSSRVLRSGDVIVTPAGASKRWRHTDEVVGIVVRMSPSFVALASGEGSADETGSPVLRDEFGTRDSYIEAIATQLLRAIATERDRGRIYAESLASRLAVHLVTHYSARVLSGRMVERPPATLSPRNLVRVIEFVDGHLGADMSIQHLAGILSMSTGHFAHAFRHTVGLPPHHYVLVRRIERAKALLRNSDLSITQIAQEIGCATPSSFSFLFRRVVGVTPSAYRGRESGNSRLVFTGHLPAISYVDRARGTVPHASK